MFRRSTPTLIERSLWDLAAGLFVTACLVLAVALGGAKASSEGEPAFTTDQKGDARLEAPGGVYISPSVYEYCGRDGFFWYVSSNRRLWTNSEKCAAWLRPILPTPAP